MSLRTESVYDADERGLLGPTTFILQAPELLVKQESRDVQIQFLNREPWIVLNNSLEAFTHVFITWLHGRKPEIQIIRNTSLQQAAYALHESFSLQKGWRFRGVRKSFDNDLLMLQQYGPLRQMPTEVWFTMQDPEIIQGALQTHILVVLAQTPGIAHNAPEWLQDPLRHMVSEIRLWTAWEAQLKRMREWPSVDRWE